jgi:uncharacterized protein DUF1266/sulfatase-modifying factor enzyme 1
MWGQIPGYDDGYPYTSPVGSFAPNRLGLYDMGGNVTQWCDDFLDAESSDHVQRGGNLFWTNEADLLSSARTHSRADSMGGGDGFRCVLSRRSPAEERIHAHALAFSAILDSVNGDAVDSLKSKFDRPATQEALSTGWGVNSHSDMLHLLRRIENGTKGHRGAYWLVFRDSGKSGATGATVLPLNAWDFGRYITVCRWGYNAGYLTESEAWEKIVPAARLLQDSWDSWRAFAADYLRGCAYWKPEELGKDYEQYRDAMAELGEAPDGLWATIPWNQSLGAGRAVIDRFAATVRPDQAPPASSAPASPETKAVANL